MTTSLLQTFVIGALFDFLWIYYTSSFMTKKPMQAATMAMWLGGASLCGFGSALFDQYHAFALILGFGAGTYAGTRWL